MTREEILKELELWPLWKLKAMVPDMSAEAVEQREPKTKPEADVAVPMDEAVAAEATVEETVTKVAQDMPVYREPESTLVDTAVEPQADQAVKHVSLQVFASDDGQCLLVHHGETPTQDQIVIRNNIARAMRLNIKLLADVVAPDQLLENHHPKAIVLFGEKVAQAVLAIVEPLEELRGIELDFNEHACVATYDMQHLIEHVEDKRKAWQDLCMALELLAIE
jgi:DNA polymerase